MSLGNREPFSKEDCLMSKEDKRLFGLPSIEKAKKKFLRHAMPCPLCKTPPEHLSWVYLVIPQWACKGLDEKEGWVTICDGCKLQINFFGEQIDFFGGQS